MSQVLDKRTADSRQYDIDCSLLLAPGETITSITAVTADQGGLAFSTPAANDVAVTYPDGRVVPIAKVVQVLITAGAIPAGSQELVCTIRALLVTNLNPALEATVLLRLTDTITP
ncbi:MAG: hypothetical protein WKG52_00810 [Variovorax sp.]